MRRGPPTRMQREIFKHIGLEYRTFRDRLAEKREARLSAMGLGSDGRPIAGTSSEGTAEPSTEQQETGPDPALAAALSSLNNNNRGHTLSERGRSGARYQLAVPGYVAAKNKSAARQANQQSMQGSPTPHIGLTPKPNGLYANSVQ